jgi:hypothetical protein
VLYCATVTRGVAWDDSGELAAGVAGLGVVHSTGYAPFVLLGHLFSLAEPFGSYAVRANLWSALTAALAVALTARYVLAVSRSAAGAVVAAIVLGLGPVFWYQASVASVYTFLACAVALLLNAADAWARRPTPLRLALLSGSIGLVALAHAVGLAFAAGGVLLIALRGRAAVRSPRDALALAAVAVPAAAIAYIPLRSGYGGFPDAYPTAGILDRVTGQAGTFTGEGPFDGNRHAVATQGWSLVLLVVVSLSPAAAALVPAGLRSLMRERPYVLCCLAPAVLDSVLIVTMQRGFVYWHIPLLLAGAVACGAGVEPVRRALRASPWRRAVGGVLAATLVAPAIAGALFLAQSHRDASRWSRATLAALPRGARLVTPWTAYAPLRAEQVLGGVRRDVRLRLTASGATENISGLRGGYAVAVTAEPPPASGAVALGPAAGANFKGLSGLGAGPFKIGYDSTTARTYKLPD